MKLMWHNYKYYPYERQLALREAKSILGSSNIIQTEHGLELSDTEPEYARRLVYFSQIHHQQLTIDTIQAKLERAASAGRKRQATRYSVHGLHEYKGKFNPQVAKSILNIFGVRNGDTVLDPFCGSGTTLVECAQLGVKGTGFDINPFAVFIANAKLQALSTPINELKKSLKKLETSFSRTRQWIGHILYDERGTYLSGWFDPNILGIIETVRARIESTTGEHGPIFLAIASNLLRDYSLQDPNDLRIRRRKTPLPETPFVEAFSAAAHGFLERVAEAQGILGLELPRGEAVLRDVAATLATTPVAQFDAALTSPPYAMALPYIDTQRLSLVWLNLVPSGSILGLEADLIGSREIRGRTRRDLVSRLTGNIDQIPDEQLALCRKMQSHLGPNDGFRRQAVPTLLYRYFGAMQRSFSAVRRLMKPNAPYALIVGHNHTVLGGVRFDFDTPRHLADLAVHVGWKIEELIELQTYQRYGYHMDNAVSAETLILLRNQ
ncbi:TRM11 family SAM-dependent methyltransferase [Methylobacterium indicum]|uniref:TRM11 family SAM-dependent methyltransferase n=1 Tax=Methylobacterium indicum TaxID=1775910 RepID=UPI001A926868|nr:DNA methyltransferase [Methylobacterium indicum]